MGELKAGDTVDLRIAMLVRGKIVKIVDDTVTVKWRTGVGYARTTTVEQKADLQRAPEPGTGTVDNYCRIHGVLRITPAMAAGVTDRVWELNELIP